MHSCSRKLPGRALSRPPWRARAVVHDSDLTGAALSMKISIANDTGKLDLSDCQLSTLPAEVLAGLQLTDLSLAGNQLVELPDEICNMTSLKRLGVAGNNLKHLPAAVGKLTNLEGLWLHGNLLETLPESIGHLTNLQQLSLSGNSLPQLPASIGNLHQLQDLGLAGNKLVALPNTLCGLSSLRKLSLHGNCLEALPDSLGNLRALEELWLMGNYLTALPQSLSCLTALKELSAADNNLEALPPGISLMPSLQKLWLYNNHLTCLPSDLLWLPKLSSVWLESNPLTQDAVSALAAQCSSGATAHTSLPSLPACGLDSCQAAHLDMQLLSTIQGGSRLVVGDVIGAGSNGYFKLQWGQRSPGVQANAAQADRVLVVAFGSAPGVPNWGGLLGRLVKEPQEEALRSFDTLYVVDSKRMWYQGGDEAYFEYYDRLQSITQHYDKVVMVGDSMGGTGALLFSTLANRVLAFCPQVDLQSSSIRPGMPSTWLQQLRERLLASVSSTLAQVTVHCGSWQHDLDQVNLLADAVPSVKVKVHPVSSHRLALALDHQNKLLPIIRDAIFAEAAQSSRMVRLANIL